MEVYDLEFTPELMVVKDKLSIKVGKTIYEIPLVEVHKMLAKYKKGYES